MIRRRLGVIVAIVTAIGVVAVVAVSFLLQSATGLVGFVGTAIADASDGQVQAERLVRSTADDLRSSIGWVQKAVDAETRAATTLTRSGGEVAVTPLTWRGAGSSVDPAVIEVRIDVVLAAVKATSIGDRGRSAGSASDCYRFTVAVGEEAAVERVDCPAGSTPVESPTAASPSRLPDDAGDRVRAVLASGAEPLDAALRSAFRDPATTIDTVVTASGDAVAAVGVPAARDCVVFVRHPDGTIEPVAFRRISLEPGEAGCSTTLYTQPPF